MIRNLSFDNNILKLEIDLTSHFDELNEVEPVTIGGLELKVRDLPFIPGGTFIEVVTTLVAPEVE